MTKVKMTVIEEPEEGTATVFIKPEGAEKGAFITGGGEMFYTCGNCRNLLLEKVEYKQIIDIILKCAKCGSYNAIPTAHHTH